LVPRELSLQLLALDRGFPFLPDWHMSRRPRQLPSRRAGEERDDVGGTSTSIIIFVLIVVTLLLYELQIILLPFLISGVLAYICTPLLSWLASRTGFSRAFLAVAVFVAILLTVALVGLLALPPLQREFTRVVSDFQGIVASLAKSALGDGTINVFGKSMNAAQLADAAVSSVREWIDQPGKILLLGGITFAAVWAFFLIPTLLFYFLYSGPRVLRGLLWLVPPGHRPLVLDIWSRLDPVLRRYFVGVLVVVAYASMAAYVGLGLVLHIPHAVFLALLTGFLEIIPAFGPLVAALIAGLVAVHYATGLGAIIGYALYATALRLSIDQLFGPLALGVAARLHPVVIMFCFIAGGMLFGIAGVIMAVPAALAIKVWLAALYEEPSSPNEAKSE
jgi:predicted PurR-regulated permease PerM